jgi:translation initiation factor 3 subunit C
MSRFWAGASSSSDSASDSDDSSSQASGGSDDNNNVLGQNRWQFSDDSSDEDEGNRVVKSGKERFQETFATTIQSIRKSMKTQDYTEIQSEFDSLSKLLTKNKQYLEAGVPRSLVKLLVNLQDFIELKILDKASFKELSAKQGRALNRLKLTLRKHNKAYTAVMEAYRKSPDDDDNEFDEEVDEDDDDNEDSSGSDSSSESGSSSSSSSSSSSNKKDSKDKEEDSVRRLIAFTSAMHKLT